MATPDGPTTLALTALSCVIREYSLFQAVMQVIQRLRVEYPTLDDDALYDRLEFQANQAWVSRPRH
jgi:type VI secretion system protein ImpH